MIPILPIISLLVVLSFPQSALAVGTPIPPSPTEYVTDTAGFLAPSTTRKLSERLEQYAAATGHQIVVWIGRTTGGVSIEEWAVKAFEAWKPGRKGLDDGVLLVVMADDRKLRIEVGYGLEGDVTDAIASRIINEHMIPKIKAGDRDGALLAGIDALIKVIGGEAYKSPSRRPPRPTPFQGIAVAVVLGLIALVFLITHPKLAVMMLYGLAVQGHHDRHLGGRRRAGGDRPGEWQAGSGWGSLGGGGGGGWGGGGSGGGGFSGGGGRSGGGGASGGW